MQFAVRPRRSSQTRPYNRSSRLLSFRRKRLKQGAMIFCGAIAIIYILIHIFSNSAKDRIPAGTPEVVIVTVLESNLNNDYIATIKENRRHYAAKHGYEAFFPESTSYDTGNAPQSWALIPALRHAMTKYPHTTYFFSLSPHSLIMNPSLSLTEHVMAPKRLESLMMKDKPVVPPDSVIHTFSHIKGDKVDLVLTQDGEGLCQESFIIRRGEWARFFLDIWFDPLFRSYNFQKAEGHALEHVIQWHPTILTKLALVPMRTINSYTIDIPTRGGNTVTYKEGDFVIRAVGCEKDPNRLCDEEMLPWYKKWESENVKHE